MVMSLAQERKAKAVLEKITKVDDKTWLLPSKSDDSKMHTVQSIKNEYECDCLGFIHTLNCYHIIAVKMFETKNHKGYQEWRDTIMKRYEALAKAKIKQKEIKGLSNDPEWTE